ncbi:uncharacterized protein LOC111337910 isoform X1 [Stylophora pistillata]|uniref:uncharacterized protein LOC111337910 isoform X1 n=1 Tax=Stylophora pistillata TaxID=50429 RepID=UPI000C03FCDC|nr:uncharacterized protein LOC111337910 isoform X1 [Stylophora pistillata]
MAFSRRELKIISIIQLVMAVFFSAFGIADYFEVRYVNLSFLFMPCWIAALVLPAGIMGLIVASRTRRSSILIHWLSTISIASVVVCAVVLESYSWALKSLLGDKYYSYRQKTGEGFYYFWAKDAKIKFEDQENTMIAIHALIVIFSIAEIILAVAMARSSDAGRQLPQQNQSYYAYHQVGNGHVALQMQPFPPQAMVAIPTTEANCSSGGNQQPQRM